MKVDRVEIKRWFDRHLHIRDGEMMRAVLPCTLNSGATGAVIMGNLTPPDHTSTVEKALAYRKRIEIAIKNSILERETENKDFIPVMTCYLTDEITPEEVVDGFRQGAWQAVKMYVAGQGGTTNSSHGVKDILGRYKVFEAMEAWGIPLLGHFEAVEPDVDEFDREVVSVERDLDSIVRHFPELKIVFEHITDARAAPYIASSSDYVRATVTAHHLMINRNAMFAGGMNPINFCKPVPKRENHRSIVRRFVTSGNKHFGAGTDSVPHHVDAKSRPCGCAAGIFTAPVAVELYATVFDEDDALEHLEVFLSENLLDFYGAFPSAKTMTLVREETVIPQMVGGVKVFKGGETLPWKLVR